MKALLIARPTQPSHPTGHKAVRSSGLRRPKTAFSSSRCESIYIPHCQNIGYNVTDMQLSPFDYYSQDESGMELNRYFELFTGGCRRNTKATMTLLVCSLYTPTCIEVSTLSVSSGDKKGKVDYGTGIQRSRTESFVGFE